MNHESKPTLGMVLAALIALGMIVVLVGATTLERVPGGTANDCHFDAFSKAGTHVCYDQFSANGVTSLIDVTVCETYDVDVFSELEDTTPEYDHSWKVYDCATAATPAFGAPPGGCKLVQNTALTGNPAGVDQLLGMRGNYIYAEHTDGAADTDEIAILCGAKVP